MSHFSALIWLKWTIFKNSLRRKRAVANTVAAILGSAVALIIALAVAASLGVTAYALMKPGLLDFARMAAASAQEHRQTLPEPGLIFFMIHSLFYGIWATVPLSLGTGTQLDPDKLLLYPISLKKLFIADYASEITSLTSIFAIPALFAMSIGAGLATNRLVPALFLGALSAIFGITLTKWVATAVGALMRKRQTRGETVVALIGAAIGIGGALVGQLFPMIGRLGIDFRNLKWSPPGAVSLGMSYGLRPGGFGDFLQALAILSAYTGVLAIATYWIAKRIVLGIGGSKSRKKMAVTAKITASSGWKLPFTSDSLSALIEKEVKYTYRNAQIRTIAIVPLLLLAVKFVQRMQLSSRPSRRGGASSFGPFFESVLVYSDGFLAAVFVLYVFMVLSGLTCNSFGFENSGMRATIVSPVSRLQVLLGKNIANTVVALSLVLILLLANQIIFRDQSAGAVLFAAGYFVFVSAVISLLGNWFSVKYPKRLRFGKKLNTSGIASLLILPIYIALAVVPAAAVGAGYLTQSHLVKYVTLGAFIVAAAVAYVALIPSQGRLLARRELEILEAVTKED